MRAMRPPVAVSFSVPALAALVVLSGCSKVEWDQGKIQDTIQSVLTSQAHVKVQSVTCPSKVKIAKGVVTYCEATLAGGDTVRFDATQTDSKGHIHIGPAEMIAVEVQDSIQSALKKRGVSTTATCPQHVPIVVGKTFVCTATDPQGHRARIGVTIADANAGFRLKLLG
jgi:hypothetical protein